MNELKIENLVSKVERLTLRGWVKLNALQEHLKVSIKSGDFQEYFNDIVKIVELTCTPSDVELDKVFWAELLTLYAKISEMNTVRVKFPILTGTGKADTLPWEYEGREWYFWVNLFARNYGWSESQIGELDIDDAIGLYQEITVDGQMGREWEWGLSEIAYPYNPSTKTQNYKPLDRPAWMLPPVKPPKTIKIRTDMMPVGSVINLTEKDATTQPA